MFFCGAAGLGNNSLMPLPVTLSILLSTNLLSSSAGRRACSVESFNSPPLCSRKNQTISVLEALKASAAEKLRQVSAKAIATSSSDLHPTFIRPSSDLHPTQLLLLLPCSQSQLISLFIKTLTSWPQVTWAESQATNFLAVWSRSKHIFASGGCCQGGWNWAVKAASSGAGHNCRNISQPETDILATNKSWLNADNSVELWYSWPAAAPVAQHRWVGPTQRPFNSDPLRALHNL